jgi:predicted nucleotidyltransferase
MSAKKEELIALVKRSVEVAGVTWSEIDASATAIILFGSHALGVQHERSDVDILCVGTGHRHRSSSLHVLWIQPERYNDPHWRGGELAGHIAEFGVWLKGSKPTAFRPWISNRTIERKQKRIQNRCLAISVNWNALNRPLKVHQLLKLRRDLQRLTLLVAGKAPLPAPVLDSQWTELIDRQSYVKNCMAMIPSDGRTQHVKKCLNML